MVTFGEGAAEDMLVDPSVGRWVLYTRSRNICRRRKREGEGGKEERAFERVDVQLNVQREDTVDQK